MQAFILAGLLVAVVSAVRGLWSPCGLSMISTITPMTEQSRGNHFWATALWFVAGATVGGASLGVLVALGALGVDALGLSLSFRAGIVAVAALVAVGSDVKILGRSLWIHPRQVDETWLGRMRAWAYAFGFGWQIGAGVTTYIMTAGVYLVIVIGMSSASPVVAFGLCVGFGMVRGVGVYTASGVKNPAALRSLHARIERLEPASRTLAVFGQLAALVVVAVAAPSPTTVALGSLAVVVAIIGLWRQRITSREVPGHTGMASTVAATRH